MTISAENARSQSEDNAKRLKDVSAELLQMTLPAMVDDIDKKIDKAIESGKTEISSPVSDIELESALENAAETIGTKDARLAIREAIFPLIEAIAEHYEKHDYYVEKSATGEIHFIRF